MSLLELLLMCYIYGSGIRFVSTQPAPNLLYMSKGPMIEE